MIEDGSPPPVVPNRGEKERMRCFRQITEALLRAAGIDGSR